MRSVQLDWLRWTAVVCGVVLGASLCPTETGRAQRVSTGAASLSVTNVAQVRRLAAQNPQIGYAIHLEGEVWWANPAEGRLVLHDATGAAELEMTLSGRWPRPGQRILLEGNGTIAQRSASFQLGAKGPVVDNNGLHGMVEKSGAVYLRAGHQPFRLDWFNGAEKYGLEVSFEGPGIPRQAIPAAALYRAQVRNGRTNWLPGLAYRCCEVPGETLPDFGRLTPLRTGTVSRLDLSVMARPEHVGLEFTGYLAVPRDGLYTFYTKSDDGSQLYVGEPSLRLKVLGSASLPAPRRVPIGELMRNHDDCLWAEVEGTVTFVSERGKGLELDLSSGTGRLHVEVADVAGLAPTRLLHRGVRAVGVCQSTYTTDGQRVAGRLLVSGVRDIQFIEEPLYRRTLQGGSTNAAGLPVLTTAMQVHRLTREEAQRAYPVRIRGVVTCVLPEHQAFVMQDSTRGLYVVDASESRSGSPQIGEYLEVEGTTDPLHFAPMVNAQRVRSLGLGDLPRPVHPTWDQLMNGSLDAQYVQLQGILTAVQTNGVTLLTRDGRIKLELRVAGMTPEALERYEDALVRVRGCLLATWDYVTHQVKVGEIRVYDAEISVDQPAPADLFSIPKKSVAQLLLFDPLAGVFQRVKVAGQIVGARDPEYYMMDGTNGLRFVAKRPPGLRAGDLVEVVGFPELSGASPVLREAVARKIGHAALPAPKKLSEDNLIHAEFDATRVKIEGSLVSVRQTPAEQVLEMRSGVRTFMARLNGRSDFVRSLAPGSRLELVGVYAGQGGNRAVGQDITSFELLLNSPNDIRVLARPPWWTLERLLVIVGALAFVLAITVLWITQLHRQVEARTAELEAQIQERQRVEHQRAMEQERTRIAQDLHDELGSGITEISMLAARVKAGSAPGEKNHRYLEQVGSKAREMVTSLDEIVWAMNPRHDSLASLVSYFSLYADRFLGLANIAWRLDGPDGQPDSVLVSRRRHQLFLVFKEALTNVVRHSRATEVRLDVQLEQNEVRLTIADNGRGLPDDSPTAAMDGVANMRGRIEKLGGRFEITSESGRGTVVRFSVPAN